LNLESAPLTITKPESMNHCVARAFQPAGYGTFQFRGRMTCARAGKFPEAQGKARVTTGLLTAEMAEFDSALRIADCSFDSGNENRVTTEHNLFLFERKNRPYNWSDEQ
jgi:hypothetical protein